MTIMSLEFAPVIELWSLSLIFAIFIGVSLYFLLNWKRSGYSSRFNIIVILRSIFVLLLFMLLLSPVIFYSVVRKDKKTIAVVFDTSKSMFTGEDKTRIDAGLEFYQSLISENDLDDRVHLYRFDECLRSITSIDELKEMDIEDAGERTDISKALTNLVNLEGDNPGPSIIITDGSDTEENSENIYKYPGELYAFLPEIYPQVDASIISFDVVEPLIEGVLTTALIDVYTTGLEYSECEVSVYQGDEIAGTKTFIPQSNRERTRLNINFRPSEGISIFRAEVVVLSDSVSQNDVFSKVYKVRNERIKVLLISSSPSPEYSTYKNILLGNRLLSLDTVCYTPVGDVVLEETGVLLPDTLNEMERYDLIVMIDPVLSILNDKFSGNIDEYIQRRGGLLVVLTGSVDTPERLKTLLPVSIESAGMEEINLVNSGWGIKGGGDDITNGEITGFKFTGPRDVISKFWSEVWYYDSSGSPRIAVGERYSGRVAVMTFGGLNGLRASGGSEIVFNLLSSIVRYTTLPHTRGPFEITTDIKRNAKQQDIRINIYPTFEISEIPSVRIFKEEGDIENVVSYGYASSLKGQYYYRFKADEDALYIIELKAGEIEDTEYLYTGENMEEMRMLSLNYNIMNNITDGNIINSGDSDSLYSEIEEGGILKTYENTALSFFKYPLLYILIILVLGFEWYLRRIWGLS